MELPVVQPAAAPWFKDGLKFQCTCSGNCCTGGPGYVWYTSEEVDRLAAHLKLDRETTLKKYFRKVQGKLSLKEIKTEGGLYDCIFLKPARIKGPDGVTRTRRVCGIYEARPLQCRTWPFWDGLLASEDAWKRAKRGCPGIDRGKEYTFEQIEALRTAKDWPEEAPGSK